MIKKYKHTVHVNPYHVRWHHIDFNVMGLEVRRHG